MSKGGGAGAGGRSPILCRAEDGWLPGGEDTAETPYTGTQRGFRFGKPCIGILPPLSIALTVIASFEKSDACAVVDMPQWWEKSFALPA
ncbi:hypothetical protein V6N11_030852 [Hibiscus sabdariffa]|uniref:Uncharacterized protein n=1 Tax=Hibiscus sabdariffa TaxID=183260 RepID=A0ABR2AIE3_9ROSI